MSRSGIAPRVLPSRTAYPSPGEAYPRIVSGSGAYLTGEDGRRYFDGSCGSGSLIFGHGDRELVATLSAQAGRLSVFPSRHFGVAIVEQYLEALVDFAPAGLDRAITYSSGSDAVEAALKLAIQYQYLSGRPGRTQIIGRRGSYHGNTLAGLSAGGFVARRRPFEAVLPTVAKAPSAHCGACEFSASAANCSLDCVSSLEAAIILEGADRVAAVIVEPVVGAALSAAPPDPRYMSQVRKICNRHGVLLIFDEVMTGFGRTGARFGADISGVTPDILICGKAMSAGYFPLSGLVVSGQVGNVFAESGGPFLNGHTHACSPSGAAVGLEVLARLKDGRLIENARQGGAALRQALADPRLTDTIAAVRGEGLMVGFDIVPNRAARQNAVAGMAAERFARAARSHGLIMYASSGGAGTEQGDHAMLLPPLTLQPQDIDFIAQAMIAAGRDIAGVELAS